MTVKVRFTPSARRQFLRAVAYIREDRPTAAKGFVRNAEERLRRLEDFPASGRRIPEFPDLSFRELVVPPYRFFYRATQAVVWVVAVWHSAQRPVEPPEADR